MKRRILALLTFLAALTLAFADMPSEPHPIAAASPTGRYVVRVAPEDHAPSMVTIYELSEDGSTYAKLREFRLGDRVSASDICISEKAEVITFSSCGWQGIERAVVWHTSTGKVKRQYSLTEILPEKAFAEVQKNHRTRSSTNWRRGQPFFNGPALLIPDTVGGCVILGDDVIDYEADKN
jgi:hypothetical protein